MGLVVRTLPFVLFALGAAMAPLFVGDGTMHLFTEIFVILVISSMWNLLAGYAGLMSLGNQMFFGLGGYAVFVVSNSLNIHPFLALPAGFVASGIIAAVVAPLLFRLRDAYFAIGSWVLAEIVAILVQRSDALGGITGMSLATTGLLDFATFEANIFWIASSSVLVAIIGSYAILRSRVGLGLMSVRDNELAAAAVGVDVWRNRFVAFVVAAAGTGFMGGISMLGGLAVQPGNAFSPEWSVIMTFVVVIGGIGSLEGPILGTLIYFGLRQLLTVVIPLIGTWYLVAMGIVAVLTMLFAPRGLWPVISERWGFEWLRVRHLMPKRG